ncbi:DNA polymerase III subunit alpha, partial [Mycoplasmopsis pullorum]
AKSAIKDVGRMLGISNSEVNLVTKTINDFDKNLTLESEYNKRNSKYKAIVSKYENLHEYATYIEGLYRQTGVHAAGIVIANNDITNYFPINKVLDKYNQVQLSLENLEKYGLIKIDFLGLKNLTIVKNIE